jgi:hypothetical protein
LVIRASQNPAANRDQPHHPEVRPRFKIIYLELTNACNFTCDYCPIDRQTRKKVHMSSDFAKRIIDEIAEHDLTEFITFHLMGEPFLHRDLAMLTGYAEDRGLRVRLLTNGSLLDEKRNEALFRNKLTRLEIGFRTPNDTSFDMRLRGGHLTLEQYVNRTKGVIDDKLRLHASTTLCIKFFMKSHAALLGLGDSYQHLTDRKGILALAAQFQNHALERANAYGYDTAVWDRIQPRILNGEYPILPGITLGFSRIQDFWVREQRGEPTSEGYPAWFGGCSAGFRDDFAILASGEVTTCCVDYDGRNVVGDLRKQTLMEVLESAPARRIRDSFGRLVPPTEFCRDCLGGPTLAVSAIKQVTSVALALRDRVASRKDYARTAVPLPVRDNGGA